MTKITSEGTQRNEWGEISAKFYYGDNNSASINVWQQKAGQKPNVVWYTQSNTSIDDAEEFMTLFNTAIEFARTLEVQQ